jgi:hypothetical protein
MFYIWVFWVYLEADSTIEFVWGVVETWGFVSDRLGELID